MKKKSEKQEKVESYDNILNDVIGGNIETFEKEIKDIVKTVDDELLPEYEKLDFKNVIAKSDEIAKETVNSYCLQFITNKEILNEQFLTQKRFSDSFIFSSILKQIAISDHTLKRLCEEIDNGNSNPRMFEVLSKLLEAGNKLNEMYIRFQNQLLVSYMQLAETLTLNNDNELFLENINNEQICNKNKEFTISDHTNLVKTFSDEQEN